MVTSLEILPNTQEDRTKWVIEGMLPEGHKGMIAACEGACKTTLLAWIAVCVATGNRIFGMDVRQGSVLMVDEETPKHSLENKIYRFCLWFGLENRRKLPQLVVSSSTKNGGTPVSFWISGKLFCLQYQVKLRRVIS